MCVHMCVCVFRCVCVCICVCVCACVRARDTTETLNACCSEATVKCIKAAFT